MLLVYLDWNIFNKLEKLKDQDDPEGAVYGQIESVISNGSIVVPYSNAHISDLYRGFIKNPSYTPGHLSNIRKLTNNLCLTQYWEEKEARWHFRDPGEFLESTQTENENTPGSFASLFDSIDLPGVKPLWSLRIELLRLQPVNENFKKIYGQPHF